MKVEAVNFFTQWRWRLAMLLALVGSWVLVGFLLPAPPNKITVATAFKGGAYAHFGARYQQRLAGEHVKLTLQASQGSLDNIRLLQDPASGVQMAFVQGGVANAEQAPGLLSLGRINTQVFWIFHKAHRNFDNLVQLKGLRVAVGPAGSGARTVAQKVLGLYGVNEQTAQLLPLAGEDAVQALHTGQADVIFLAFAAEAPLIQSMLHDRDVKLMNVSTAEGLTRVFPFLVRLVLPQGVVDFEHNIPERDVTLIGTTNAVLVREDLHPEMVHLLARTLAAEHGQAGLFQRTAEFPTSQDPEYPMAPAARDFYLHGPSFLHRYLPFWVSNYAQRMVAMLAAGAALFFPIFSYAPRAYRWWLRERMLGLYRRLRQVEVGLLPSLTLSQALAFQTELDGIDHGTRALRVPARHSDLFFALKADVDLVRARLLTRIKEILARHPDVGDTSINAVPGEPVSAPLPGR